MTQKTDRLGRVTEYVYNPCSQLTTERWKDGSTTLRTLSFEYDLGGTGDHVRIYKEALRSQAGASSASIGRALSVIRGAYAQFGKRGLIDWKTVGDIQAVGSPRVDKNTTPALSESEAKRLLHAPDESTLQGTRRAILCLVKKHCRQAAINPDRVGRRGFGVHSLRKTAITNALEHGAKMEQVQALAGHSDIRTTQLYYRVRETDAEVAARHIQIR